jgi:hypothetical protein
LILSYFGNVILTLFTEGVPERQKGQAAAEVIPLDRGNE